MATAVLEDVQLAELVTLVPLEVAVNVAWDCVDWLTLGFCGLMVRALVVLLTVMVSVPLTAFDVAVMVAVPTAMAVTSPAVLTVAMLLSEVVHVRLARLLVVLPSLLVPVAVSCNVELGLMDGLLGVTAIEVNCGFTKNPRQPAAASVIRTANAVIGTSALFDISLL